VDTSQFRQLCGRFATGVVVVTASDRSGEHHGMTANSFTSVSLDPPLVSINVERAASFHAVISEAERFALNVLSTEQEAISRHFAGSEAHRFEGYRTLGSGQVVLEGVIAAIECAAYTRFEVGDHTVFVGQVIGGEVKDGRPLLYFRGGYHELG
jgi:flavin reductase (DIM6/NTAB) family NADH-FMN oxidoreductase RutF